MLIFSLRFTAPVLQPSPAELVLELTPWLSISYFAGDTFLYEDRKSKPIHRLCLNVPPLGHTPSPLHYWAISQPLLCTLPILGVISNSGSPSGDSWFPGLSQTLKFSLRGLCLEGGSSACFLLVPHELSQLIILSNSLVWSKHLLTDSYTVLMSVSSPRHILTFTFSLLTFHFSLSTPHKKKRVDCL